MVKGAECAIYAPLEQKGLGCNCAIGLVAWEPPRSHIRPFHLALLSFLKIKIE